MANDNPAIQKLLDALRENRSQYNDLMVELTTLLQGGEGIGSKVTRLKAAWVDTWTLRYGSRYEFANHAMVGATLKRWLKHHTEDEIIARMLSFVKSDDPFYVRARHAFEVFVKAFNQCVGLPKAISDPSHEQAAETAREMRGV